MVRVIGQYDEPRYRREMYDLLDVSFVKGLIIEIAVGDKWYSGSIDICCTDYAWYAINRYYAAYVFSNGVVEGDYPSYLSNLVQLVKDGQVDKAIKQKLNIG